MQRVLFTILVIIVSVNCSTYPIVDVTDTSTTDIANKQVFTSCQCNIQKNICNDKCCCDPSCQANLVFNWQFRKECKDQVYGTRLTITQCSEAYTYSAYDLMYPMRIIYDFIVGMFCLQNQNVQDAHVYVDPISDSAAKNLMDQRRAKIIENQQQLVKDYYLINTEALQYSSPTQKMTIYRPNFIGLCQEEEIVYMRDFKQESCKYQVTNYLDICDASESILKTQFFTATKKFKDLIEGGTEIDLTVRYKYKVDPSTNSITNETENLDTTVNTIDCSCTNLISHIDYNFKENATEYGQITSGFVDIIVQDHTFGCGTEAKYWQVTDSVNFYNNDYYYYQSGSPGYEIGKSLSIGYILAADTSEKFKIQLEKPNYQVKISDSLGLCTQRILTNAWESDGKDIKFGYDASYQCSLQLSYDAMKALCLNGEMYKYDIYTTLIDQIQYIGSYASANSKYIKDWVKVKDVIVTQINPTMDGMKCSFNIPMLNIFYYPTGNKDTPQYRIYQANIQYIPQTWSYFQPDTASLQDFQLNLLVKFIEIQSVASQYQPPLKKLDINLPENWLYPFLIEKSIN